MTETPDYIGSCVHTVEVNLQEHLASGEAEFMRGYSGQRRLAYVQCFIDHNTERAKQKSLKKAEAAIRHLEKRLGVLENEKFKSEPVKKMSATGIEETRNNIRQNPCETDFIENYSCIYVSPIYENKKGSITSRTQVVEDGNGVRNRAFDGGMKEDGKDLEIKRLKAELQRQRLRDIEEERYTIADKFIDRINTIRTPNTISRPKDYHETQHSRVDQIAVSTSCGVPEGSPGGSINRHEDSQGFEGPQCETPMRSFAPNGFLKIMKEKFEADKKQNAEVLSAVPDIDRSVQAAPGQQIVNSFLATMQGSVENLCSSFKTCDSRDSDSSKINSGAIEDELFILRKTLSKLGEMCQESGYQYFLHRNAKEPLGVEQLKGVNYMIPGRMQHLAKNESKKEIALDYSSIDKDRKGEDLQSRMQAILQESKAITLEKFELTTRVQEMTKEAEKQRHQIEELQRIKRELSHFSQAKEDQLTLLNTDIQSLRRQIEEIWEENGRLSQEVAGQHKALKIFKKEESALRKENETLKLRLTNTEYELTQREEELEKLAHHVGVAVEKDVLVFDKVERGDHSLRYAATKEKHAGVQITQTRIFIEELEEKLFLMETEVLKAIKEMQAM